LQRKGKGGDGEQVKVCLACFSGATWQILPASGCAQDGIKSKLKKCYYNGFIENILLKSGILTIFANKL